jgi:anthranilate synthase component 1
MITRQDFNNFVDKGFNMIPIAKKIYKDNETPLSIYSRLNQDENSFLLESVEGGIKWAQYSILGIDCKEYIKVTGNTVETFQDNNIDSYQSEDPLGEVSHLTSKYHSPDIENLPRFYGGYVGFFAYESARYAEKKINSLQSKESKFKEHMPEIYLVKSDKLIVFDNTDNSIQLVYNVDPSSCSYDEALNILESMEEIFLIENDNQLLDFKKPTGKLEFNSNFKKDEYLNGVKKIKDYILEGDAFQVVLAQDFSLPFDSDPFELYKALRVLNPSPYMYYLNLKECKVVGASPEILIRLEQDKITLRPIAGTRKRGQTIDEDKGNEIDLLNDPKEIAEHLMLIDLGRNDVGKISEIGSVKVTDKMIIEKYSHVMHIVSNITGRLLGNLNYMDAIKSSLPAGTLSGAPKIRAMEIINEIEPSSRGIYGGAIGYISWNGDVDTAIAIRTAVIKDSIIHVGAGAGVVADSIPEKEWEECKQKAKVFLDALEMIQ